jgi:hypothetical protein
MWSISCGDASHLTDSMTFDGRRRQQKTPCDSQGSAQYLYADDAGNTTLLRSPINDGTHWTSYCTIPSGRTYGSFSYNGVTSSFDGTRWYMVTSNNDVGIWRYIEQ